MGVLTASPSTFLLQVEISFFSLVKVLNVEWDKQRCIRSRNYQGYQLRRSGHCDTGWYYAYAGREFSAGEHQLQLFEHQRKGLIQLQRVIVAKGTLKSGPIGEKMQAVALLHQTSSKTGREWSVGLIVSIRMSRGAGYNTGP